MLVGKQSSVLVPDAIVARRLSPIYVLVIVIELAVLSWKYATDPPAPSAPLSVGLGWAGLGSMIAMLVYVFARRMRALRRIAPLSEWLNLHIFLGVQGVLFVTFHSLHIFSRDWPTYWANPAIVNFFAVLIVFGSGIFGRYMYSMLPKTARGDRMAIADAQRELAAMTDRMPAQLADIFKVRGRPTSFVGVARADLDLHAALRAVDGHDLDEDIIAVAKRRIYLEWRLKVTDEAQRFFRWWIILHRPLSAVMYILSILHVILTYMFTPSLAVP